VWKNSKGLLCLYIVIVFVGMILPTIVSYSQSLFISSLEKSFAIFMVLMFLITYVAVKFIKSIYQYVDSYFAHKFIYKVNFIFNTFLTKALYNEPQQSFYNPAFIDRLNKISQGQGVIPFQIFSINGIVTSIVVLAFIQIPLIVISSPILMLLIALDSIFTFITARKFAKGQYELEQRLTRDQRKSNYYGGIFSSKANAKELRIFGAQEFFFNKWKGMYTQLNQTRNTFNIKKQKTQILISMWNFLMNSTLLVILFYQLINKSIEFGSFIFLYNLIPAASNQLKTLIQAFMGDSYTNYLNIQHYIDYANDIPINKSSNDVDFHEITLENVSYRYPTGNEYAVKNISLSLKKGEIVSILGYNGSGKSTLSKLLTGVLCPLEGEIFINGELVNERNKNNYSCIWGLAYQDFTHYLLSIKDNIGFGYIEKYDDKNIEKAFKDANCNTMTNKLPYGLETLMGKSFYDDGIDLSGGEWQKIALARAYMGNHHVLILDEPTASIDPMKELEMLSRFKDNLKDRTAILISHRIGFARLADKIIMMDKGMVVESGSHDELLAKDGFYAKLFNAQKELYI
jgi:ABC-type multidrug transport system fused ATPase/permease subunit